MATVFRLILSTPIIKRYKNKTYAKARFYDKMRLARFSFYPVLLRRQVNHRAVVVGAAVALFRYIVIKNYIVSVFRYLFSFLSKVKTVSPFSEW